MRNSLKDDFMQYIHLSFIALLFHSNAIFAAGLWYEFEGSTSYLKDYTSDKILEDYSSGSAVYYTIYIDYDESGYWFNGINKIKRASFYYNEETQTNNSYARYECGSAILNYHGFSYNNITHHQTPRRNQTRIDVGSKLTLFDSDASDIHVGQQFHVRNSVRSSTDRSTSTILANVQLIEIHDTNPCLIGNGS